MSKVETQVIVDNFPIQLTERALIAIKEFKDEPDVKGDGLRVGIRGGGCAGYQYVLDFTDAKPGDFEMNFGEIRVYIDPISAMHLEGTTIDYQLGLSGAGFKFDNPVSKTTCGCGSSFST